MLTSANYRIGLESEEMICLRQTQEGQREVTYDLPILLVLEGRLAA